MKNIILCFTFLFASAGLFAQTDVTKTPAEEATEALTTVYQLNEQQQAEMLEIQQRKYRNLGEIAELKDSDPLTYLKKIRAMQHANIMHMQLLLNETQLVTFQQKQRELREEKARVSKEMKSAGKSQAEINAKMTELDENALLRS